MSKRVVRVYIPYLLFLPLLLLSGYRFQPLGYIAFPIEPYHFIATIIALYPLYYFVMYLDKNTKIKTEMVIALTFIVQIVFFFFAFDKENGNITQPFSVIGCFSYFIVMLLGSKLQSRKITVKPIFPLLLCVICFIIYTVQSFVSFGGFLRILQWEVGIGFSFCIGLFMLSIEEKLKSIKVVDLLANLTLEIYLVQYIAIQAFSGVPFPVGMIYCLIAIVAVAYVLHKCSTMVSSKIVIQGNK